VVALAAATVALLVTPFAFLGEFVVRRRIIYRGAWWRAARRGLLSALLLAALAGLRLGGALTVPAAIFVAILAVLVERFLATRDR
jgi:ABC-type Mn2+/Zn2+ transport system permease subunit